MSEVTNDRRAIPRTMTAFTLDEGRNWWTKVDLPITRTINAAPDPVAVAVKRRLAAHKLSQMRGEGGRPL